MLIKKWLKEIKIVGLRDWLWFVIYLRRNEFSPKLNINVCRYFRSSIKEINRITKIRERAHKIDMKIGYLK